MSNISVTALRQYSNKIEAETIRLRLAAAGIQAIVTGEDAGTALGLGGAMTNRMVRVEVAEQDYERAAAILAADDRKVAEAGPWVCGRCGEQNEAAFEVCWSCDKTRSDEDLRGRIQETTHLDPPPIEPIESSLEVHPHTDALSEDGNPYRPVLVPDSPPPRREARVVPQTTDTQMDVAKRCFRAAVVGVIVLPPVISFYAVYLLLRVDPGDYRLAETRWRLITAWCINLVNIPGWLILWTRM